MPRAKQQPPSSPTEQEELLERLVEAIERLEGESRILGETLDRIEDDLAWALKNDPRRKTCGYRPRPCTSPACRAIPPPLILANASTRSVERHWRWSETTGPLRPSQSGKLWLLRVSCFNGFFS